MATKTWYSALLCPHTDQQLVVIKENGNHVWHDYNVDRYESHKKTNKNGEVRFMSRIVHSCPKQIH